jgi:hypothetical protein
MKHALSKIVLASWVVGVALVTPRLARAQEDDSEAAGIEEITEAASEDSSDKELKAPEAEVLEDDGAADNSPVEKEDEVYRFIGLRYRGIIIPSFIISSFVDGAESLYINGIGPEFGLRRNGLELNFASWLSFYSMDDTALKGKGDPATDWGIVSSSLKLWYFTVDIMGSKELKPGLSIHYGGGAGIAAVFGDIIRSEAYPPGTNPAQPGATGFTKCPVGFEVPPYCSNDTVTNYSEPSWLNGGSKPVAFPWLALQTGLRYKPHKKFVARLDLGVSLTGFYFGLAGAYGL